MNELTEGVNWIAVIIGFVLSFGLGALWYSPTLFGTKWRQGVGLGADTVGAMPAPAMILQALGTFLLSWLVGITAAHNALWTIILIALTIIALMAGGGFFIKKSQYAILAEIGFVAAMVVVMIIVEGIVRHL